MSLFRFWQNPNFQTTARSRLHLYWYKFYFFMFKGIQNRGIGGGLVGGHINLYSSSRGVWRPGADMIGLSRDTLNPHSVKTSAIRSAYSRDSSTSLLTATRTRFKYKSCCVIGFKCLIRFISCVGLIVLQCIVASRAARFDRSSRFSCVNLATCNSLLAADLVVESSCAVSLPFSRAEISVIRKCVIKAMIRPTERIIHPE